MWVFTVIGILTVTITVLILLWLICDCAATAFRWMQVACAAEVVEKGGTFRWFMWFFFNGDRDVQYDQVWRADRSHKVTLTLPRKYRHCDWTYPYNRHDTVPYPYKSPF